MTSTATKMSSSSTKFARAFSLRDRKRPRSRVLLIVTRVSAHQADTFGSYLMLSQTRKTMYVPS